MGRNSASSARTIFSATARKAPPTETFERAALAPVVGREHKAIREGVALIDMSSFSKFEITGPGAVRYLNWLAAGNIDKGVGAVVYTQLLNARGGIEADLTIMQPTEGTFYVVTGSGFGVRDGGWIRKHMPRNGSVAFKDVTSAYGVINLCGPRARDVLEPRDRERRLQRGLPVHDAAAGSASAMRR